MPDLRRIHVDEFVRRMNAAQTIPDRRYAFFLGAGCSVSSGIKASRALITEEWLPRLRAFRAPERTDHDAWIREEFPNYDPDDPAASYGDVIHELFPRDEDRQAEFERLCTGAFPGFAYAVLARLMARPGGSFNVALTTNFDDLVPDALYLYTADARPLVIPHESLAKFIRPMRTRPLVVKLHGDHHLAPYNTAAEVSKLHEATETHVRELLVDRGLVFFGYGGADKGILDMLEPLGPRSLSGGVFWVAGRPPKGGMLEWLRKRHATWVECATFDEAMVRFHAEFELGHPDPKRFASVFDAYKESWKRLSTRTPAAGSADAASTFVQAVEKVEASFADVLPYILRASRLEESDPDAAQAAYADGLQRFPTSADLLGPYAVFMETVRVDHDEAERLYTRALEADPNDPDVLGNYASFLEKARGDDAGAERMYKRALEEDADDPIVLANYAGFLARVRRDHDAAEELYRRALAMDEENVHNLVDYATFLTSMRGEHDGAEALYERALQIDSDDARALGGYAVFLEHVRGDDRNALHFFERAFKAHPEDAAVVGAFAAFLHAGGRNHNQAQELYERALKSDPNDADNLGNYAAFRYTVRRDVAGAEALYLRALAKDRSDAGTLGNLAGLLLAEGRTAEGMRRLREARALPEDPALTLELAFYAYAHGDADERTLSLGDLKGRLARGDRSPGWDLSRNVARAVADGHPEAKWLDTLARVVADRSPYAALVDWPAWKAA